MLLILGMFFILVVNVNLLTESAKDQFDMVEVYMLDDATDDQINTIMDSVKTLDYTDTVEFLDKDDAMDEMKDRWGDNGYLLDGLQENPLPRSIRITLKNIEDSQELVDYVSNFEGIEKVKYDQSEINKILNNEQHTGRSVSYNRFPYIRFNNSSIKYSQADGARARTRDKHHEVCRRN